MVNFINSWAQSIILAIVIATIIEMIIPNGNNKKYVKTIIGIYVIFVMISPIITKFTNKNFNVDSMIENLTKEINKNQTNNIIEIKADTYIEDIYINKIKEEITNNLNEKGYGIEKIDLLIENSDEEKYGEIKELHLQIVETKDNNIQNTVGVAALNAPQSHDNNKMTTKVNEVEEIKIDIFNKTVKEETNKVSVQEISYLKEYFINTYGVQKVYINEH